MGRYLKISVDEIIPRNWSYRVDDRISREKLKISIRDNGLLQNLIVRELPTECFEIVDGQERFEIIKEMEYEGVQCYSIGKVSSLEALKISLEANEIKILPDTVEFAKVIKRIMGKYSLSDLAKILPFNENEIKSIVDSLEFDWSQYDEEDGQTSLPFENE